MNLDNLLDSLGEDVRKDDKPDKDTWAVGEDGPNVEIRSRHMRQTGNDFNIISKVGNWVSDQATHGKTGMHIHIGVPSDFDMFDVLAMSTLVDEKAIKSAVAMDRDFNSFAKLRRSLSNAIYNRIHEYMRRQSENVPKSFTLTNAQMKEVLSHFDRNHGTNIEITIDEDGTITMLNDGNGIDVAEHPEHKMWIPEMIFGHLRTSTNYDKTEKKIVGGKNGFGFKLVLIWSTYGSVETVDHVRGLKYKQEFKNNLEEICKPSITKCKNKPYTKITFKPDYKRLGISNLTPDIISLLKKRTYDVAAITDKNIKVKYNNNLIPIKNFQQYIDMYIGDKSVSPRVYEDSGDRWEYAVALTPTNEFVQILFVNGIHTAKGGKHVEYILNQITRKICDLIEKKKKVKVNPNTIKEQLILFVRCDIENPAFDSQTKDFMNTPSSKFGSKCDVSDKFIEKVAKMGVMDAALQLTEVKENKAAKKTDGTKTKSIRGIPKLTDANWAGTEKSKDCIIIFCEGDSAKAGIISGLTSEDRNTIGVYPMKGKIRARGSTVGGNGFSEGIIPWMRVHEQTFQSYTKKDWLSPST